MPSVASLIAGYGPKFPSLETLLGLEPAEEQLVRLSEPVPALGRYFKDVAFLSDVTSQRAVGRVRFRVLVEWFITLAKVLTDYNGVNSGQKVVHGLSRAEVRALRRLGRTPADVVRAEMMERFTEHDTAAAGDYMKIVLGTQFARLEPMMEGFHFGNTSEDVMGPTFGIIANTVVYGHFLPKLLELMSLLLDFVDQVEANGPLVVGAFTHKQAAEPTTVRKKFATMLAAIEFHICKMMDHGRFVPFTGKFGGGVGNMSTHFAAYPDIDWRSVGRRYVQGLGLTYEELTFQSSTYALEASHFTELANILTHLIKFAEDFVDLAACSNQFFIKRKRPGMKGSSLYAGKCNAWGIEGAIAMLEECRDAILHLACSLPVYPHEGNMKRSYLMRNIGNTMMPAFIAMSRIGNELVGNLTDKGYTPNPRKIAAFFNEYPWMVGSCIQSVLKRHGIEGDAYRQMESISINPDSTYADAAQFAAGLERVIAENKLSAEAAAELMSFTNLVACIGDADKLAVDWQAGFRDRAVGYRRLLSRYQVPLI